MAASAQYTHAFKSILEQQYNDRIIEDVIVSPASNFYFVSTRSSFDSSQSTLELHYIDDTSPVDLLSSKSLSSKVFQDIQWRPDGNINY